MLNFKVSLMNGVLKETENNAYSIKLPVSSHLSAVEGTGKSRCILLVLAQKRFFFWCIVQCSVFLNLILKFQVWKVWSSSCICIYSSGTAWCSFYTERKVGLCMVFFNFLTYEDIIQINQKHMHSTSAVCREIL